MYEARTCSELLNEVYVFPATRSNSLPYPSMANARRSILDRLSISSDLPCILPLAPYGCSFRKRVAPGSMETVPPDAVHCTSPVNVPLMLSVPFTIIPAILL